MFHVPNGSLVVPSSLSDVHEVLSAAQCEPIPARNLPAISARSKMRTTTVVVGSESELESAVRAWGSNPTVAYGAPRKDASLSLPSGSTLAFLTQTSAPSGTRPLVVGDVHNCHRTLRALLEELNITPGVPSSGDPLLVFVGDLVDKGGTDPLDPLTTLELVFKLSNAGQAVVVRGNHEQMLVRRFIGISPDGPSSQQSLEALRTSAHADRLVQWLSSLPLAFKLPSIDGTEVTVVHANASAKAFDSSLKARRHAEQSCLFGRKTASPMPGVSIHGHWEVDEVICHQEDSRLMVNVDTGACLGGKLSAYDATMLPSPGQLPSVSVPTEPLDLRS